MHITIRKVDNGFILEWSEPPPADQEISSASIGKYYSEVYVDRRAMLTRVDELLTNQ